MTSATSFAVSLRRALAAQARSAAGDLVLVGVCAAALVLSASIAANVPADLAGAPDDVKASAAAPVSTAIGVYSAVLAAVYGSFRYTTDRRAGVVAQRATLLPRPWTLAGRLPFTALGGAVVAAAAVLGGRLALSPTFGVIGLDVGGVVASLVVGAVAALWGMSVGLIVQAHLPSLFAAALSLSAAFLAAPLWPSVAAWLPLPVLLRAAGHDLAPVGIESALGPAPAPATALAAAWVAAATGAGAWTYLRRDLR